MPPVIDKAKCGNCGTCIENCPLDVPHWSKELAHLYPALYVDHTTGSPNFPKIRRLLDLAELATEGMSESQLSRELGKFKSSHPTTTAEIKEQFELIESGDLKYFCNGFLIY